jgi:CRISPR-associated protein Csx17
VGDSPVRLPAVPIPGLAPDSPGNYFASLGLLRLLARKWPRTRIGWREGVLHVVDGPTRMEEVLDALAEVAEARTWTPYERRWAEDQKRSTKAKSGAQLAIWRARADENELELFDAHAVPAARVNFNPVLGSGGNAGKRIFAVGWKTAVDALAFKESPTPKKGRKAGGAVSDPAKALEALLRGEPTAWALENLNGASWFSDANKLFNNGQSPFRDGRLSPWSMALACEGLAFLAGGASRRLGARAARSRGAFPFVTDAAAPLTDGEAGRDSAEFWAPLWDRPMTLPEVQALFVRGRAEVRGRGVLTPSAFATAVVRRGVDAGISEFRRFVFGRTTSANTFEPRFEGTLPVHAPSNVAVTPTVLERTLRLVERLLSDRTAGQHRRFVGLRGPIEEAILRLAAAPEDPAAACRLLDAVVAGLDRVDRNRRFRERRIAWEPLPAEWLSGLWEGKPPEVETWLALALVSGFPASLPFAVYRFGVDKKGRQFEHPVSRPARHVWAPGPLARVLSSVVQRRVLDWEELAKTGSHESVARCLIPASLDAVNRWLEGAIDDALVSRWISRLALFDWAAPSISSLVTKVPGVSSPPISGSLALFGLLHSLFDVRPLYRPDGAQSRDMLEPESGARTPAAARALASLMRAGQIDAAVRLASNRYAMAGAPLARRAAAWRVGDSERLLASVLFPISDMDRAVLIERWLRPRRRQGGEAHD